MKSTERQLSWQLERILDEASGDHVEVIVQMDSGRDRSYRLAKAASEALGRRRLTLTPRDLLPRKYREPRRRVSKGSAGRKGLMSAKAKRASAETLLLAQIQRSQTALSPLLTSGFVKAALGRIADRGGKALPESRRFWTSRSMPLRLSRDELVKLPNEVRNIKSIHVNRRLSVPSKMKSDPLGIETDELFVSTWGLEKIKALATWGAHGARGQGVKIGLLDTGVDALHPDLIDANGKSKIADWAEFDSMGQPIAGSTPHDTDEHGTHCAGTLVGGNTSGRSIGVAPDATVAAALVLDGEVGGTDAQVLAGIDWAVDSGVDVLSLSLGGLEMDAETPPTYTEAILTCVEAGIPVVVAIGNEGHQTSGSPGNDLFALSVGATDPGDRVAGFSGGRTQIIYDSDYIDPDYLPLPYSKPDLAAPGVAIHSSVPGEKWTALSGTSMATPHVAGAIALLLSATSIASKLEGEDKTYLIESLITGAVEDMGESGQDHRFGFGRLDILRAVDFAIDRGYGL